MWKCKTCEFSASSRSNLLKHYKLKHKHFGRSHSFPCMHSSCPCSFKTWNALLVHLSRVHANHQDPAQSELTTFSCPLCSNCGLSCEKDYFAHIGTHLKKNEVITCMFSGCDFQTNVYGTFRSHKNRNTLRIH